MHCLVIPKGSMYGICTNIYHKNQPNVGNYTKPMDPSWDIMTPQETSPIQKLLLAKDSCYVVTSPQIEARLIRVELMIRLLRKTCGCKFLRTFQQTPGAYPKPPTNSLWFGIPFIWGFRDVWGMLQGYVGFPLESLRCWHLIYPPETNSSPLKINGWKMKVSGSGF